MGCVIWRSRGNGKLVGDVVYCKVGFSRNVLA